MAEEELDYGGCLSTSVHYTARNKRDVVHLEDHLLPARNSEHMFEHFSTDTTSSPGRFTKYKHLLDSPPNDDTKWQVYHTKTGQLTGYLRYREKSSSSKCPPSSGSVSTSPWKPAFNANSPFSLSSAFPSPTVFQNHKGSLSPHRKRDTGTHRKITGLQPQGEDCFGRTQTLNKTIDAAAHSISSAPLQTSDPTGPQSDQDQESQLQAEGHPQHKPPEEDSTSHGEVVDTKLLAGSKTLAEKSTFRGEADGAKLLAGSETLAEESISQDDKTWTDGGQIDRPSHAVTQDKTASNVSSSLPLDQVQTDQVTVVSAGERGRELFAETNELSLQAQALDKRYPVCVCVALTKIPSIPLVLLLQCKDFKEKTRGRVSCYLCM